MTEQIPDVIYVTPDLTVSFLDIFENRGKYLLESHVEATTVPKADFDHTNTLVDRYAYERELAKRERDTADNRYAKLLADSVPRDKVEALIEAAKELAGDYETTQTADNGYMGSYATELLSNVRKAIRSLEDKG